MTRNEAIKQTLTFEFDGFSQPISAARRNQSPPSHEHVHPVGDAGQASTPVSNEIGFLAAGGRDILTGRRRALKRNLHPLCQREGQGS